MDLDGIVMIEFMCEEGGGGGKYSFRLDLQALEGL